MTDFDWSTQQIHFVTGKLARSALQPIVDSLSKRFGFRYTIQTMPITVAALMTAKWTLRHLAPPEGTTRIILPGYLAPGLEEIQNHLDQKQFDCRVECGPKDLRELPRHFGVQQTDRSDYGAHRIEILAEINHANRLPLVDLVRQARQWVAEGADRIDLGCDPAAQWTTIRDAVKKLRDEGIRLSIDTFDPWEAAEGTRAGADLVLSVNRSNRHQAIDWGAEVVVVPDMDQPWLESLMETSQFLHDHQVPYRLDPILEPIGCGFAKSLHRYYTLRQHAPDVAMMMGIGNLTELTDSDSAGINTLLLGYCEELQVGSILTTQVIPWAQSSVRECHLARKLVHYAVAHSLPPKHLEEGLVMLRDPTRRHYPEGWFEELATTIQDPNYRIFSDGVQLHLVSAGIHLQGTDPMEIFSQLHKTPRGAQLTAGHAFYLGFELAKAMTALTLGKNYEQDEALRWGMLTREEEHARLTWTRQRPDPPNKATAEAREDS
ncbi:MAG: DUF6513 domain-containing protein [Pirellulaceae bacterium]